MSSDPHSRPDPQEVPPAEEAGAAPEPATEPGVRAKTAHRRTLAHDLAEVERGRPERAFNVGATLGVVLTVAAAIFVLQNNQSTGFDWLWFDFRLPLWTVLIGSLAAGALLVLFAQAVHRRRQRRIGRRTAAAGRLRQELGPSRPEGEAQAGTGWRSWLRRRRDPMRA